MKSSKRDSLVSPCKLERKSMKKPISNMKIDKNCFEPNKEILYKKYSVGKTIGRGLDSVVKICRIRKDWIVKNIEMNNDNNIDNSDTNTNTSTNTATTTNTQQSKISNTNPKTRPTKLCMKLSQVQARQTRYRAMKIIDKAKIPKHQINDIYNEVSILKQLAMCQNENIVRCEEVYEAYNKIYIITELLSGDTLESRIINTYNYGNLTKKGRCGKFREFEAALSFFQILKALECLHNQSIVHRDLKPENLIFLGNDENNNQILKLIDFGLATRVSKQNESELTRVCGTPLYVAPEMLQKQSYNTKIDMWAAGIILYFMLCGYLPFKLRSNDKITVLYKQILKANVPMLSPEWHSVSVFAKDLIRKLLIRDPERRLSASQALEHPWFKIAFAV